MIIRNMTSEAWPKINTKEKSIVYGLWTGVCVCEGGRGKLGTFKKNKNLKIEFVQNIQTVKDKVKIGMHNFKKYI